MLCLESDGLQLRDQRVNVVMRFQRSGTRGQKLRYMSSIFPLNAGDSLAIGMSVLYVRRIVLVAIKGKVIMRRLSFVSRCEVVGNFVRFFAEKRPEAHCLVLNF